MLSSKKDRHIIENLSRFASLGIDLSLFRKKEFKPLLSTTEKTTTSNSLSYDLLPPEMLLYIMSFLLDYPADLINFGRASRKCYGVMQDESLWQAIWEKRFKSSVFNEKSSYYENLKLVQPQFNLISRMDSFFPRSEKKSKRHAFLCRLIEEENYRALKNANLTLSDLVDEDDLVLKINLQIIKKTFSPKFGKKLLTLFLSVWQESGKTIDKYKRDNLKWELMCRKSNAIKKLNRLNDEEARKLLRFTCFHGLKKASQILIKNYDDILDRRFSPKVPWIKHPLLQRYFIFISVLDAAAFSGCLPLFNLINQRGGDAIWTKNVLYFAVLSQQPDVVNTILINCPFRTESLLDNRDTLKRDAIDLAIELSRSKNLIATSFEIIKILATHFKFSNQQLAKVRKILADHEENESLPVIAELKAMVGAEDAKDEKTVSRLFSRGR